MKREAVCLGVSRTHEHDPRFAHMGAVNFKNGTQPDDQSVSPCGRWGNRRVRWREGSFSVGGATPRSVFGLLDDLAVYVRGRIVYRPTFDRQGESVLLSPFAGGDMPSVGRGAAIVYLSLPEAFSIRLKDELPWALRTEQDLQPAVTVVASDSNCAVQTATTKIPDPNFSRGSDLRSLRIAP